MPLLAVPVLAILTGNLMNRHLQIDAADFRFHQWRARLHAAGEAAACEGCRESLHQWAVDTLTNTVHPQSDWQKKRETTQFFTRSAVHSEEAAFATLERLAQWRDVPALRHR